MNLPNGADYLANHAKRDYHKLAKEKEENYQCTQEHKATPINEMVNIRAEMAKELIQNGLTNIVKAVVI